ncbi:MAG: hypothetical protein H0U08_03770 [Actinobacteria bacterium]|nr:hypothetical protein [Actinomycetota bacterium]
MLENVDHLRSRPVIGGARRATRISSAPIGSKFVNTQPTTGSDRAVELDEAERRRDDHTVFVRRGRDGRDPERRT